MIERGVIICTISIVKREKLTPDGVILFDHCIYRILIIREDGTSYEPVYPFVASVMDLPVLQDFVEQYEEDLLMHYLEGDRICFSRSLHGFDTALKERFKQRWFERGLLID